VEKTKGVISVAVNFLKALMLTLKMMKLIMCIATNVLSKINYQQRRAAGMNMQLIRIKIVIKLKKLSIKCSKYMTCSSQILYEDLFGVPAGQPQDNEINIKVEKQEDNVARRIMTHLIWGEIGDWQDNHKY